MTVKEEDIPYTAIAQQLADGEVVPVLGAAASFVGVPESRRPLPDGRQLAKELIEQFGSYPGKSTDPLTKVAQFYEEAVLGRTPLYNNLHKRFHEDQKEYPPNPTACLLAKLKNVNCIVTTNYDNHVERAFEDAKRPYTLLTHITNRNHRKFGNIICYRSEEPGNLRIIAPGQLTLSEFKDETIIYKFHGSLGPPLSSVEDSLILTEDDYVRFINMSFTNKIPPPALSRLFQSHHLLFLGYSLEDWNFRIILRRLQDTAAIGQDYTSWAVRRRVAKIEEIFWDKRGVKFYAVDLSDFVARIREKLELGTDS
jgi:hypothetical protein